MRTAKQLEFHLPSWGGRRARRRAQARIWPAQSRPPTSSRARPAASGACHDAAVRRIAVSSERARVHRDEACVRGGVPRRLPCFAFQRAGRSRTHACGSRRALAAVVRCARSRDSDGQGDQSRSMPPRGCLADRFHARALSTPREVRNALVYVLQNWKKHEPVAVAIDPRSSGEWFVGWRDVLPCGRGRSPVAAPRTWLLRIGWWRHGRIAFGDGPRA